MKLFILLIFTILTSFASSDLPLLTSSIRLTFDDKEELESSMKELVNEEAVVSIMDQVGKAKVDLRLRNDYNFHNVLRVLSVTPPDDIGLTHGFKISIHKDLTKIKNDQYYATITYESNLYTNSTEPEAFQEDYFDVLYRQDGVYMADVYFKEENFVRFIINKIKKQDAFYWSAQGGYHEINTKDSERPLLLSSITQQDGWHGLINSGQDTYRHYNYLDSNEGSKGFYAEIEAAFDKTIHRSEGSRAFVRYGANSRLTQVEGASYIGGFVQLGYENGTKRTPMRFMTGLETKAYTSGTQSIVFVEASRGEDVQVRFRISKPLNKDPNYLNPFPQDFENRDQTHLPNEVRLDLGISGKFKQR